MSNYLAVGKRGASCLKYQKRVAASIFNVGPSKIWLDPARAGEICKARTREALRVLIDDKAVKLNVNPRKPKPKPRTEIRNRAHLISQRKQRKSRMKQKAEYHRRRAQEQFPLSSHPSLAHLVEKEEIIEKE